MNVTTVLLAWIKSTHTHMHRFHWPMSPVRLSLGVDYGPAQVNRPLGLNYCRPLLIFASLSHYQLSIGLSTSQGRVSTTGALELCDI